MKKITFIGGELEAKDAVREATEKFADIIGMPIFISNSHGSYVKPYEGKEELHIYFWSSPKDYTKSSASRFSNKKIFGETPTNGGPYGFLPSEDPVIKEIKCPEGHTVAEVHKDRPHSLHILFDLPHQPPSNAKTHLEGILKVYCDEFTDSEKMLLDILSKREETLIQRQEDAKENIDKISAELSESKVRAEFEYPTTLKNLEIHIKDRAPKHKEEFRKIKKEALTLVRGNSLMIFTEAGTIIFNIKTGSYEALKREEEIPVIIPFYEVCKGPAKAGLAQFIGRYEYYAAYKIIKRWLINHKQGGK